MNDDPLIKGLASMAISHPHFASPGKAIEEILRLRRALSEGNARIARLESDLKAERENILEMKREHREELAYAVSEARAEERESRYD